MSDTERLDWLEADYQRLYNVRDYFSEKEGALTVRQIIDHLAHAELVSKGDNCPMCVQAEGVTIFKQSES